MASPAVPNDTPTGPPSRPPSRPPSPRPATPAAPSHASYLKGRMKGKKSPQPQRLIERVRQDKWNTSPPQITSYLTYPRSEPTNDRSQATYESPICGLGWRFRLQESFTYQASSLMPRVQELVGQVGLTFLPHLCSSVPLSKAKVNVKVSYPMDEAKSVHEKEFTGLSLQPSTTIGTYTEPPRYQGQTHIEVTLTFNPSDDLCLPTTPSVNTRMALHHSLDGPTFVDAKFYLFSARVRGRPALPKAVFAKSVLLADGSSYLRDLLTPGAGFASGTGCDLRKEVPEELAKLEPDAFEYDSDSDLEDQDNDEESDIKGKRKVSETSSAHDSGNSVENTGASESLVGLQDGRAFAINGTAYKTWKAFIFFTYLNDIQFNEFKSQQGITKSSESSKLTPPSPDVASCSPKSMYRFADYADIPQLKSLAKEGIRKNLTKANVVAELFSSFTSKYQEIMELEVEFLVDNFTHNVARELDEMLQLVVMGTKPYCFRVLAFTMRRLRGERVETAWSALGSDTPKWRSNSPLVQPTSTDPIFPDPDSKPVPGGSLLAQWGGDLGGLGGWGLNAPGKTDDWLSNAKNHRISKGDGPA